MYLRIYGIDAGDLDGDIFNIITSANESLLMVDGSTPGEYEGKLPIQFELLSLTRMPALDSN